MSTASNAGHLGIILVGVGFPLYLLFKGKLPAYLAFARGSATGPQVAAANSMAAGTLLNPPGVPSTLAPGMVPALP